jgi:hypothetical protein
MACLLDDDDSPRQAQRCTRRERRRARIERSRGASIAGRAQGGASRVAHASCEANDSNSGAARKRGKLEAEIFPLLRRRLPATARERCNSCLRDTPPRQPRNDYGFKKTDQRHAARRRTKRICSAAAASFAPRSVEIRQNIIGHRACGLQTRLGLCADRVRHVGARGTFAMLDQPARQHGRGVFLHPTVQQLADFLAQIGGVSQTGKLIALQGVTRSGKEKLPRGLSAVAGQKVLQQRDADSNSTVIIVNGTVVTGGCGKLWKFPRADNPTKTGKRGCEL